MDQKGSIWSKHSPSTAYWKVKLNYSAHGDGEEIADGLAFWFVPPITHWDYKPHHESYGGPGPTFKGLMIAVDVHKQYDDRVLARTNEHQSAVLVVYNEVPRVYDWDTEGHDILSGRCLVTDQHKESELQQILIVEYVNKKLNVYHTSDGKGPQLCVTVNSLAIPSGYNFGISAGTGGIDGTFDVHSFELYEYGKPTDPITVFETTHETHSSGLKNVIIVLGILLILIPISSYVTFSILMKRRVAQLMEQQTIPNTKYVARKRHAPAPPVYTDTLVDIGDQCQ